MSGQNRAIFLDRDGVINEMVYYPEHGIIDSPFTVDQFHLLSGVSQALKRLHERGFKLVLVSNQPGIAKGHMTRTVFENVRKKMSDEFAHEGIFFDAEYYCFHHPRAIVNSLRKECECRKPKPGLLRQAASELDIDLTKSWTVGDGLTDISAGHAAGCRTILVGRVKCDLCRLMDEKGISPDVIVESLEAAVPVFCQETTFQNTGNNCGVISGVGRNGRNGY